jgi:hypothetical protein
MTWAFHAIGTPQNLQIALAKEVENSTGPSKAEFKAARPHLHALIGMNMNPSNPMILKVDASGYASITNGAVAYSTCIVNIQALDTKLV